tara:strand:- start:928 stop:3171 length:2244 start_codon:yes stop_codon:yes gene_type:complete
LFEFLFKYSRTIFENSEFLFARDWPLWALLVLILITTIVVGYSLIKYKQAMSLGRLFVLGFLQVAMIVVLLTLLWRPSLSTQTLRPQENSVAVVIDASASMSHGEGEISRLQQAVTLLNGGVLEELSERFNTKLYTFAANLESIEDLDEIPAPGDATRIGDALVSVLQEAGSSALGAVVLISDGADNSETLDAAKLAEIGSYGVPIHAVGVGREAVPEDIELREVVLTAQSMVGSRVSAQVSIQHSGPAVTRIRVYDGDMILASEDVELLQGVNLTTHWVEFDTGDAGVRDLRFSLDAIPGENNTTNNVQYRTVQVPEERRSILYVEGEPRWEYKFVRRALEEDSPIRLASLLRTTPNKFYRQGIASETELENGFPETREALYAYDALIIGSFAAAELSEEQQLWVRDFVSERGGSLLMLGGRRGLADGGWGNSIVAEALPAQLPEIDAPSFVRVPVKVALTTEGEESLLTSLSSDAEMNTQLWAEMPEIADFQYLGQVKSGAVTLLEADVRGTPQPLLVHQRFGKGVAYILASGGTWRWQMQLSSEDQRHETFWRQILQALVSATPRMISLTAGRAFYGDQNEITLRAQVQGESYQPVSDAAISLAVRRDFSVPFMISMSAVPGEPGTYETTILAEEDGLYHFEAAVDSGGELLGTAKASVRRVNGISEHFQYQQNRSLLERLSNISSGQYFTLGELDQVPEAVQFSEAGILERELLDLWNMPFNFLLLLFLKCGEWVLRLYWGRL